MRKRPGNRPWYQLTPRQRGLLRRLASDGPLLQPQAWEMATIRSLKDRGLIRPKNPRKDGPDHPGKWFLVEGALPLVQALSTDGRRRQSAPIAPAAETLDMTAQDDAFSEDP